MSKMMPLHNGTYRQINRYALWKLIREHEFFSPIKWDLTQRKGPQSKINSKTQQWKETNLFF